MVKNSDIAKRMIDLAETGLEGVTHAHQLSKAGNYEAGFRLLADVVQAFSEIEMATNRLGASSTQFIALSSALREGFSWVVQAYEQESFSNQTEIMESTVLPRYKEWHAELKKSYAVVS